MRSERLPERLIENGHDILIAALAMVCAIWGGLVSYFRQIQQGAKHSLFAVIAHLATSGFAGLLGWLACMSVDAPAPIVGITCGLAGHAGVEAIKLIEQRFVRRLT